MHLTMKARHSEQRARAENSSNETKRNAAIRSKARALDGPEL